MTDEITMCRNELKNGISSLLNILRAIYKNNNNILVSIDKAFENNVLDMINLIPQNWIKGCTQTWRMLYGMAQCIDFKMLSNVVKTSGSKIWFTVDSKEFILNKFIAHQDYSKQAKSMLNQILNTFDPLFVCINHMFKYPSEICDNLSDVVMINVENSDIFNL